MSRSHRHISVTWWATLDDLYVSKHYLVLCLGLPTNMSGTKLNLAKTKCIAKKSRARRMLPHNWFNNNKKPSITPWVNQILYYTPFSKTLVCVLFLDIIHLSLRTAILSLSLKCLFRPDNYQTWEHYIWLPIWGQGQAAVLYYKLCIINLLSCLMLYSVICFLFCTHICCMSLPPLLLLLRFLPFFFPLKGFLGRSKGWGYCFAAANLWFAAAIQIKLTWLDLYADSTHWCDITPPAVPAVWVHISENPDHEIPKYLRPEGGGDDDVAALRQHASHKHCAGVDVGGRHHTLLGQDVMHPILPVQFHLGEKTKNILVLFIRVQ